MSYNPHLYKHLFKKGLFGCPDACLKTWDESHRLFALNQEPFESRIKKLAPGLILRKGHIRQESGFSNYVVFEVDTSVRPIETFYSSKSVYPIDAFKRIQGSRVLLNLGYYYLTTHENLDKVKPPGIRVCNLAVYRSRLVNLPIINRSAFLHFRDGRFALGLIRAKGTVRISDHFLTWGGSKTKYRADVVVYNSSNIEITNVRHPIIGPFRTPNRTYITSGTEKKFLLCRIRQGKVSVLKVEKGRLLVNPHDLILEVGRKLSVKKGDRIEFLTVDQWNFREIDFAVSIGPILKRTPSERLRQLKIEGLDKDPFLSNSPHREGAFLARGCLVDLGNGRLATISIDGIPQAGNIYPGATPQQLYDFVAGLYPDHKIAVCTDPSNTVKAIFLNDQKTHVFGNTHYLAYRRLRDGGIKFWPNGIKGRKLHTMFVIK